MLIANVFATVIIREKCRNVNLTLRKNILKLNMHKKVKWNVTNVEC